MQNQFKKISTSYFSIPQVAESVRLQAELHEKEKLILRQQRQRCKKVYKDLESLRTKMSDAQGKWNSEHLITLQNFNDYYNGITSITMVLFVI